MGQNESFVQEAEDLAAEIDRTVKYYSGHGSEDPGPYEVLQVYERVAVLARIVAKLARATSF